MKRMLIIGHEVEGVPSISWLDAYTGAVNLTDFQIVLLDLTTLAPLALEKGRAAEARNLMNFMSRIQTDVAALLNNGYPVVYILPRVSFYYGVSITPIFNLQVSSKYGLTINFDESDQIIGFYKDYISKHVVIMSPPSMGDRLMWNNIKEICAVKVNTMYVLHPPDPALHNRAIESIVDYFSPDTEVEKEEKPEWVMQYELDDLGLKTLEVEIHTIEEQIESLSEKREKKLRDKERIAQWSDLITKQGKALELRLKAAFELLGAEKVVHEPNGTHGPDIAIHHGGMSFTMEVEGSKGSIKIEKGRQLLHWIADAIPESKGVLIANPFREIDPSSRPPENHKMFVKEVEDLADSRNFALVTSHFIFSLVSRKLKGEDVHIDEVFARIFNEKGTVN